MPHDVEDDRPISVRLGGELKAKLDARAEQLGIPRSDAIRHAVAIFVERPDLAPGEDERRLAIDVGLAAAAITPGTAAVGPLKGIAGYLYGRGHATLAALCWASAARAMLAEEAEPSEKLRREVSNELAHTAATINKVREEGLVASEVEGRRELATALWREALEFNPSNLVAASRLGQALYFRAQAGGSTDDFREAAELLLGPSRRDNYALLFRGLALLRQAQLSGSNRDAAREALRDAMETWAFGNGDATAMKKWLNRIEELNALGESELADQLVSFAEFNSNWQLPD